MKNSKVDDRTDMDERLEQLDWEWRRKYEELDNAWQVRFRDVGDTIHALVDIMCDAIKTTARDRDTVDRMGRVVRAGLARLRAINSAAEAERDPGARLN